MIGIVAAMADADMVAEILSTCHRPHRIASVPTAGCDLIVHVADTHPPLPWPDGVPVIVAASAVWIAANDWRAIGYVAAVARGEWDDALPAAVADWSPRDRLAVLDRLAGVFGVEAVGDLLDGLARLLEDGVAERDEAARASLAHRIAGLAGTLGFAALGREWLRVAEGERADAAYLRRITALALATIAQARAARSR